MSKTDYDSPLWAKSTELFTKIAGPGVIGRTCAVVIAFLVFSALLVWKLTDQTLIILVYGTVLVLVVGFGIAAFWYANKHPDHSSAEGEMLYRLRALQVGAKNPEIVDLTAAPTNNTASISVGSGTSDL